MLVADFGRFMEGQAGDAGVVDAAVEDASIPSDGAMPRDADTHADACTPESEICNGVDDDCDTAVDEGSAICELPNAVAMCVDAMCAVDGCQEGYANCSPEPGCESSVDGHASCGGCGTTCDPSEICADSTCRPITAQHAWFVEMIDGRISPDDSRIAVDARGHTYWALSPDTSFGGTGISFRIVSSDVMTFAPVNTVSDYAVFVAFDSLGDEEWNIQFLALDGSVEIAGVAAADTSGNLYIAVNYSGSVVVDHLASDTTLETTGGADSALLSVSPAGEVRWHASITGAGNQSASAIAVSPGANAYVFGEFRTEFRTHGVVRHTAGSGGFVAHFSSTGRAQNHTFYDGGSFAFFGADADASGNLYVVGQLEGTLRVGEMTYANEDFLPLVIALDADLNLRWSRLFDNTVGYGEASEFDIAVADADPYLFATITEAVELSSGVNAGPGGFIAHLASADGAAVWARGLDDVEEATGAISTSAAGDAFVFTEMNASNPPPDFGGGPISSNGADDAVLASFHTDGSYRVARTVGGLSSDHGLDIAVHDDGRVMVLGYHRGALDVDGISHEARSANGDLFLLQLDD